MKVSERSKKLAGVVEEQISFLIQSRVTPEEVGFLTITAVEISGDLGICDVFVKSLGANADYLKILKKQEKRIAQDLAKIVKTRRIIQVRFRPDKSGKLDDKLLSMN
ncbi:ribosome-binding factor A [Candidatus Gracilibacteria bacterium]|nr:ribosome-binding factor A [Candidatus Gracilibacteria bacterium]